MAALPATLTVLSYMATAVISASEAMHYLEGIVHSLDIRIATIIVLIIFTGLAILGIGESAFVAVIIFIIHLCTLLVLVITAIYFIFYHGFQTLDINWHLPIASGSLTNALFFGFAAAMFGISGFESSVNFIEEQQPGVFPKTLRNMWAVVSFFNPLLAFLIICIIPIAMVEDNKEAFAIIETINYYSHELQTISPVKY